MNLYREDKLLLPTIIIYDKEIEYIKPNRRRNLLNRPRALENIRRLLYGTIPRVVTTLIIEYTK